MAERIGVVQGTEILVEREPKTIYVGSLEDLGLGSPEGIPSALADASDAEKVQFGEALAKCLSEITDYEHHACIDGRCVVCNADNSEAQVRGRQVSGTGSTVNEAHMAGAAIVETIPEDATIEEETKVVEEYLSDSIGLKPSAHEGGCGGVNGAIEDKQAIAHDPVIMSATKTVMNQPDIAAFTGVKFNDTFVGQIQ